MTKLLSKQKRTKCRSKRRQNPVKFWWLSVFSYLDILSTPFDIEILINDICAEFFFIWWKLQNLMSVIDLEIVATPSTLMKALLWPCRETWWYLILQCRFYIRSLNDISDLCQSFLIQISYHIHLIIDWSFDWKQIVEKYNSKTSSSSTSCR